METGTGLGLLLCKEYVQLLTGFVLINTKWNHG